MPLWLKLGELKPGRERHEERETGEWITRPFCFAPETPTDYLHSTIQSMFGVDDYRWLSSDAGRAAWLQIIQQREPAAARSMAKALAKTVPCTDSQSQLLLEQWQLATGPAKRKFVEPTRWFWTQRLLEQASDEQTARETALDFPEGACIVDACCGAGADSVALAARASKVTAIDRDEVAAVLAGANAAAQELPVQVQCMAMEDAKPQTDAWLHLDPDRRPGNHRTIRLESMVPSWSVLSSRIGHYRGVSIKLAPGLREALQTDWGAPGPPQTIRWLSRGGSVRQQRWYWNVERWAHAERVLSVETRTGAWSHEVFRSGEWQVNASCCRDAKHLKTYIADTDPSVRAADLGAAFAHRHGVECLGNPMGYMQSDRIAPHPMMRWFRLLEVLPMDRKRLRAYSRANPARVWELKSRNIDVDLDALRKELIVDPDQDRSTTLLLTRLGERHIALVAEEAECL